MRVFNKTDNFKILLVNPPVNRLCEVPMNYFPLGLGYLVAVTNRMGFKTHIYNAELETRKLTFANNKVRIANHRLFIQALKNDAHFVWKEYRELLNEFKPSIVGFSCTSASILSCLKMAEDAKKISNAITVFGGMHPTILPEETARYNDVDYIVAGDGERSFSDMVKSLAEGKEPFNIPGVGGYRDNTFHFTPPAPIERNLDALPFPDRDALTHMERHRNYLQAMVASRGCPYKCTFCSGRNITGGIVRYRGMDNVIEEIKYLKEHYGVTHITFYDDAFIINKKKIMELCQKLIHEKMEITWSGFTRADSANKELLALMKTAGCIYLGIGVESGSDRTLSKIKKGYTREQAIRGVKLIKESGIDVSINIIIGFPFERVEDVKDSITLIKELEVPTNINTFTPYPKSELYDECVQRGLIGRDVDWGAISQHSPYNQFIQEMTSKDYRKMLDEMVTVADRIFAKRNRRNKLISIKRHIKRINEIWHEEKHHPVRFAKIVAEKAVNTFKNRQDMR